MLKIVLPALAGVAVIVAVVAAILARTHDQPTQPEKGPAGVERTEQPPPGSDPPGVDLSAIPMPKGGPTGK